MDEERVGLGRVGRRKLRGEPSRICGIQVTIKGVKNGKFESVI
jgi:hypothetical protein